MDWPDLTIGVCTYRRPTYAACAINVLNTWIHYDGRVKFHISDGGSPQEEIDVYKQILWARETSVEVTNNLADMVNSIAVHGGEIFMVILDDFFLRHPLNINPDIHLLLDHPDIGCVRMSRMSFFGQNYGELINQDGLHYWKLDKERSSDNFMATIGVNLYHRRFFEAYGLIPSCEPKVPGQAEHNLTNIFNGHPGPTVAIPMRFGEDADDCHYEPFWHVGTWRTDDYFSTRGSRL